MKLDSNKLSSDIDWVCQDCGSKALELKENKGKRQFDYSTWHTGKCDVCGENKHVTEVRDFGYPIFNISQ